MNENKLRYGRFAGIMLPVMIAVLLLPQVSYAKIVLSFEKVTLTSCEESNTAFAVVFDKNGDLIPNASVHLIYVCEGRSSLSVYEMKELFKGVYTAEFPARAGIPCDFVVVASYNGTAEVEETGSVVFPKNGVLVRRRFSRAIDPTTTPFVMVIEVDASDENNVTIIEIVPSPLVVEDAPDAEIIRTSNTTILIYRNLHGKEKLAYIARLPEEKGVVYSLGRMVIEDGKGDIVVEGYPAQIVADPVRRSDAFFFYTDGTNYVRYSIYDGSSLTSPYSTLDAQGTPLWIEVAAHPSKPEMVMASVADTGVAYAQVWNGSSWGNGVVLTTAAVTAYRSIDVAYEQKRGRAMVVYADGSSIPKYRIWDGSSWSDEGFAMDVGATVNIIELGSNPTSDEIIMVTADSARDENAQVWDGSAWTNLVELRNDAYANRQSFDVACQSISGTCFVFYADNDDRNAYYAVWNGVSWSYPNTACFFGDFVRTMEAASDPNSNRIVLMGVDRDSDVHFCYYDGSTWYDLGETATTSEQVYHAIDVEFEAKSGDAVFVYNDNTATPKYRILPYDSTSLTAQQSFPSSLDAEPYWIKMVSKKGSDEIALITLSAGNDVNAFVWDGSAWQSLGTLTTASSGSYRGIDVAYPLEYFAPSYDAWGITDGTRTYVSGDKVYRTQELIAYAHWENVSLAYLNHNGTGVFTNYTIPTPYTANWTNTTIDFSNGSQYPVTGKITFSIYAKDVDNVWNKTQPSITLELWGFAEVSDMWLSDSSINNGSYVVAYCKIRDNETLAGIAEYNVSFYLNSSFLGWNVTNSNGVAQLGWVDNTSNPQNPTVYNVSCNITDMPSLYYNASDKNRASTKLEVYSSDYDVTPPTINWIDVAPQPAGFGVEITITANITDDKAVDHVIAKITPPGEETASLNMVNISQDLWSVNYTGWKTGDYTLVIYAYDSNGNVGTATTAFSVRGNTSMTVSTSKKKYAPFEDVHLGKMTSYITSDLETSTKEVTTYYGGDVIHIKIGSGTAPATGTMVNFNTPFSTTEYATIVTAADEDDTQIAMYGAKSMSKFNVKCEDDRGGNEDCNFNWIAIPYGEYKRGDLIIKAGSGYASPTATITFNSPMPTNNYAVLLTAEDEDDTQIMMYGSKSTTGFSVKCEDDGGRNENCNFNWIVIPYGTYQLGDLVIQVGTNVTSGGDATVALNSPMPTNNYAVLLTAEDEDDTQIMMYGSTFISSFNVRMEDDRGGGETGSFDWMAITYGEYDFTESKMIDTESQPYIYNDVFTADLDSLYSIEIVVETSYYDPSASVLNNNAEPDLEVLVFNGSGFESAGILNLPSFYTSSTPDSRIHNFTIVIDDADVLSAWLSDPSNRDIEIRGVYLDSYNETTIDKINYTGVWVRLVEKPGSELRNVGDVDVAGYLKLSVEKRTSTNTWNEIAVVMNDLANSSKRAVPAGTSLNLSRLWESAGGWNPNGSVGTYRVRVEFLDEDGNPIVDERGNILQAFWEFEVALFDSINATPNVIGYGEQTTLSAVVTDESIVSNMSVVVVDPEGNNYEMKAVRVSQNTYAANFSTTWKLGSYTYYFIANLRDGSSATSSSSVFNVSANTILNVYVENDTYGPYEDVNLNPPKTDWWNKVWHYRVMVNVSVQNQHTNFPIELDVNFTQLFQQAGCSSCTLDVNSIRVVEHGNDGDPLYEVPSKTYFPDDFDAARNAIATVIWVMNGTTPGGTTRIYYIYFDSTSNGQKPEPSYNFSVRYSPTTKGVEIDGKYVVVFDSAGEIKEVYLLNGYTDLSSGDSGGGREYWYWSYEYWTGSTYYTMSPRWWNPLITYGPVVWINASVENGQRYTDAIIKIYKRTDHSWVLWLHNWHNRFDEDGGDALIEHFVNIQNSPAGNVDVRECNMAGGTPSCSYITVSQNGGVNVEGYDWVDARFYNDANEPEFYITYIMKNGSFVGFDDVPWDWTIERVDQARNFDRVAISDNPNRAVPAGTEFTRDLFILITDSSGGFAETTEFYNEIADWPSISLSGAEFLDESSFNNVGETGIYFYLEARVQRWDGSSWVSFQLPVIDDRATSTLRYLTPGEMLNISTLWNPIAWNTSEYQAGTYRVYFRAVDPWGNTLKNGDGTLIEGYDTFEIIPPKLELTSLEHENRYEHNINEYEITDTISWINVTVNNYNATAIDAKISLNILDYAKNTVDWGPNETKLCGSIPAGGSCEVKYDNGSAGYPIPVDATPGTYTFHWNVTIEAKNYQATTNTSQTFVLHHIPSGFSSSIYPYKVLNGSWTTYNFTMYNFFSKNLTDVNVTINCPEGVGITCTCYGTSQPYCYLPALDAKTNHTFSFNISTSPATPVGEYVVNVTVTYTNPGNEAHTWYEVESRSFFVKQPYLDVRIVTYPIKVTRGSSFVPLEGFVNNTDPDGNNATNLWLNWSLPAGWINATGELGKFIAVLPPATLAWNNITVNISLSASLGEQKVVLKGENPQWYDLDKKIVVVYANTTIQPYTNQTDPAQGETVLLRATLRYDNSTPISYENISFVDETAGIFIGWDITDASGVAEVTYTLPLTASTGNHTINMSFDGNDDKYINPTHSLLNITVHGKPNITAIAAYPDPQGYGKNVTIKANVTSVEPVDTVIVYITYPNGSTTSITMLETAPGRYSANFSDTWQPGNYSYYVGVNTTASKTDRSQTDYFTIEANTTAYILTDKDSYEQNENVSFVDQPADWWNRSWPYRVEVNVTEKAGVDTIGYPLEISFNPNGHVKSDCEDIRIIDASSGSLIRYRMLSCTSTNVTLYLELNISANQKKTYHIYYGNPLASGMSDDTLSKIVPVGWETPHPYPANIDSWNCDGTGCYAGVPVYSAPFTAVGNTKGRVYMRVVVEGDLDDPFEIWNGEQTTRFFQFDPGGLANNPSYWNGGDYGWSDWYNTDDFTFHFASDRNSNYWGVDVVKAEFELVTLPTISVGREETIPNQILNTGNTSFEGYLTMKVQRKLTNGWQDVDVVVNDLHVELEPLDYVDLDSIWNGVKWNTDNLASGTYRVVAMLTDPAGNLLVNGDGTYMMYYDEFEILPPPSIIQLVRIKVYDVTNSTSPRTDTSNLEKEGLNTTFLLFTNRTYRVEVIILNNETSQNDWWVNTSSEIMFEGINPSWSVDDINDVWYEIGGIEYVGGTYDLGQVWWDHSLGGVLPVGSTMKLSYIVNTTSDSSEILPVRFFLNGTYFVLEDNSTFKVVKSENEPPKLYNSIYGLTPSDVIRDVDDLSLYARWNEEISQANFSVEYASGKWINSTQNYDIYYLPPPPPENWTNYTTQTNLSWSLGEHRAKIAAADLNGNWNDTLPYLTFTVWGRAYLKKIYADPDPVVYGQNTTIYCRVVADNGSGIFNYSVQFYYYDSGWRFIGENRTNESGYASMVYHPELLGHIPVKCIIGDYEEKYWIATVQEINTSVWVVEIQPPWYDISSVGSNTTVVHKGDAVELYTLWYDDYQLDSAWVSTNESGSFVNNSLASSIKLNGTVDWSNFTIQIPTTMAPGYLGWKIYANDTSANVNGSMPANVIEVWGWAEIRDSISEDEAYLHPSSILPGGTTTMYCRVRDVNGSGIANYNVSFYENDVFLGWNLTNATGWATFTFSESNEGTYTIKCNISDDPVLMYNATSNNYGTDILVVGYDTTPPYLFNNVYGINTTKVYKGQSLLIYARWNETVGEARVIMNTTKQELSSYPISLPSPNSQNWTNYTITTNSSWITGTHHAKIEASDQVGNWNDTLPFQTFEVWGYAKVFWQEPIGIAYRSDSIPLKCKVVDKSNNNGIANYPVKFYDTDWVYIGMNYTDANGIATMNWNALSYPPGDMTLHCIIATNSTLFYEVKSGDDVADGAITLYGNLSVVIDSPTNNANLTKGQMVWLNSTIYEDNGSVTSATVNWYLNGTNIASGEDVQWQVPYDATPGRYVLKANATKQHYVPDESSINVSIFGYAKVSFVSPASNSSYPQASTVQLVCSVSDTYTGEGIANYTVHFYVKNETDVWYLGNSTTNSTGFATLNWYVNPTTWNNGTYNVSCNITDEPALYYYASSLKEDTIIINITKAEITAWLEVIMTSPPEGSAVTIAPNRTFVLNATVICHQDNCGEVSINARYNSTGNTPDTTITNQTGAQPFYIIGNATQKCTLNINENCTVTFIVNVTALAGEIYAIDVNASSINAFMNESGDATIEVRYFLLLNVTPESIALWYPPPADSSQPYTTTIATNELDPQTRGAKGKDVISVKLDDYSADANGGLWVKATNLVPPSPNNYVIAASNLTLCLGSTYDTPIDAEACLSSSSNRLNTDYVQRLSELRAGELVNFTLFIDIPAVQADNYVGTLIFLVNATY